MEKSKFAGRLRAFRADMHISQSQLAHALGINRQTLSNYENGERTPDVLFLKQLCLRYHVSPKYFLGLQDSKQDEYAGIAAQTGLSDDAINQLQCNWQFIWLINKLIASDEFNTIVRRLSDGAKRTNLDEEGWDAIRYQCLCLLDGWMDSYIESILANLD